jgi:hypothetical protein
MANRLASSYAVAVLAEAQAGMEQAEDLEFGFDRVPVLY